LHGLAEFIVALLRGMASAILDLDEAMSDLDAEGDFMVQQVLVALRKADRAGDRLTAEGVSREREAGSRPREVPSRLDEGGSGAGDTEVGRAARREERAHRVRPGDAPERQPGIGLGPATPPRVEAPGAIDGHDERAERRDEEEDGQEDDACLPPACPVCRVCAVDHAWL
jgi:hypothetical protein